jgi:6,7-dimethyl-8-ribityllumazine synthase
MKLHFPELDGSTVRVGIVTARWNPEYTEPLRDGAIAELTQSGVLSEHIEQIDVAGAYEVLAGARYLMDEKNVDVVICIGVLVKGETDHYEYISLGVTNGIANLNAMGSVPVVFGLLTCQTSEQARERSTGSKNHGPEWAKTAIEIALLRK